MQHENLLYINKKKPPWLSQSRRKNNYNYENKTMKNGINVWLWMALLSQRSIIIYQRNFSSIYKNKTPEINPGVRKQIKLIRVVF